MTLNISRWLMKEKFSPSVAELHITDRCNLNCKTCWKYNQKLDCSDELQEEQWHGIIHQLFSFKVKECYICGGGEPMSRYRLTKKVMLEIKKRNIKGSMTTNCTLFDEKTIKKLVSIGWDSLQVSMDGADKKTQNSLRGKGVFEKNIKILQMFNKWKKRLKKSKPHISFHTVISNKNHTGLTELIKLAYKLQVEEINIQPLVIQSENCKNFILRPKQKIDFQRELKRASKLAKEKKILTNFEKFMKKSRNCTEPINIIKCYEPWNRITIQSNGFVKTCCNPSRIHESLHEKSLEKIWFGKKFNKLRKQFYKGKLMKECCTHPNKR